jgi:cytochrome b561
MTFKDTPFSYGLISKVVHWTVALLVLANLIGGLLMDYMPKDLRFTVIMWHKSFGAVVLVLMLFRFGWRAWQGFPQIPAAIVRWQRVLAHWVHVILYPLLIVQPITGWLLSSAAGHPVSVFGLFNLPDLVGRDKALQHACDLAHDWVGYTLAVLLTAHIGAALHHHFIEGNKLIRRML